MKKHKVLKAKIPRFHFLNYNMGEEFRKSVMTIENDLHFALGIGEHLERRLSATDLKTINFSLQKKFREFEQNVKVKLWRLNGQIGQIAFEQEWLQRHSKIYGVP